MSNTHLLAAAHLSPLQEKKKKGGGKKKKRKSTFFFIIHKSTPKQYLIHVVLMGRNTLHELEFQRNSEDRKATNT